MDSDNFEYRKYLPFSIHSDWKNVFYDSDIKTVRRLVKDLNNVVDAIEKRFERHDTLQIAKSVFDYCTQREFYNYYPHLYYDFRSGDCRICIGLKNHNGLHYFVNVQGWRLPDSFNPYISKFGYGDFDTLEKAKMLFFEVVRDFILPNLGGLF